MNYYDYVASINIPLKEIESATNNFARKNLITRGSYAHVYKGKLLQSKELIDIVVRKCPQPKENVVVNEVTMYKDLNHKNIISLFKFHDTQDHTFTIHKQEANGSLDKHLEGSSLTWMQRLQICVGVAQALRYIHSGLNDDYCVIHGNIKSSKILLDHNWEPKLHDFRSSVKVKRHRIYLNSNYNGTLEYMDPSFESTGGLTHKSDVFSFGVVLFEVLFGMKASIPDKPVSSFVVSFFEALCGMKAASTPEEDHWCFADLAKLHYEEKRLDDMIDPDLRRQMDNESLKIFSEIAYCCLKEQQAERPDIDQIVNKLERALALHQKQQSLVHSPAAVDASSSLFKGGNLDHMKVPLSEIVLATKDFSTTNYLTSGGFGEVYKAKLDRFKFINSPDTKGNDDDLPNVAIKCITSKIKGEHGFIAEIEMLSKCKHPNIVSLLGFCHESQNMIIIYEYASKGSLNDYLKNSDSMTSLTWAQRIQISLDIARGLDYIHESAPEKQTIIHCDVKSANILLDDNLVAKIADFGLSKLAYNETFKGGLAAVARQCYKDGTLKDLLDPKIKKVDETNFKLNAAVDQDSWERFIAIASQCVLESQSKRPTMKTIIKELEGALFFQQNSKDRLHISLKDIQLATDNFNDSKCTGEGRYWKQYDGEITHANVTGCNTVVAKRWDSKYPESQQ
ncbi:uncharacterized protein LOC143605755, partial [Bidens hawaiensis]|uniref:uncharacterized protein LOC143605755 n=1 Tax=Bidens hawaiensis TaxID=980011 RepID=UPI00404AE5C1